MASTDIRDALLGLCNYNNNDPDLYDGDDDGVLGRLMSAAQDALESPRLTGSITFDKGIPHRLHHEGVGYTVQPIFTSASKKIVDTEFKEGVPIHLTYGGVTYDVLPPSSYVMEEDDPSQQHHTEQESTQHEG